MKQYGLHYEWMPVLGFGFARKKFRKPEFSKDATIYELYLPFVKIVRSVYHEEKRKPINLSRKQRRYHERAKLKVVR